jgi:hypothetical protein
MKKTLRLRREALTEITAPELVQVRGGTSPFSTQCVVSIDARCLTLEGCMTPPHTTHC